MDFADIEQLQHQAQWEKLTEQMCLAAQNLQRGGAECIVICTNTMHRMADEVAQCISIPLLPIADATARQIQACGIRKVGLLGTAFTMEQDFYKGRLRDQFGLEVCIPDESDRQIVHHVIYTELVKGIICDASRQQYRQIIQRLINQGAEAIILGCTEIMLLVSAQDSSVPLFDTTRIHALSAVDWALKDHPCLKE